MIEENAKIVSIDASGVVVETQRKSVCGQCAAKSGCGNYVLGKFLGKKRNRFLVAPIEAIAVGDDVTIGLREQAMVRGSLAVYIIPLFGFIGFGILGELLSTQLSLNSADWLSVVMAFIGLLTAAFWLRIYSSTLKFNKNYHPVLLRRNQMSTNNIIVS